MEASYLLVSMWRTQGSAAAGTLARTAGQAATRNCWRGQILPSKLTMKMGARCSYATFFRSLKRACHRHVLNPRAPRVALGCYVLPLGLLLAMTRAATIVITPTHRSRNIAVGYFTVRRPISRVYFNSHETLFLTLPITARRISMSCPISHSLVNTHHATFQDANLKAWVETPPAPTTKRYRCFSLTLSCSIMVITTAFLAFRQLR